MGLRGAYPAPLMRNRSARSGPQTPGPPKLRPQEIPRRFDRYPIPLRDHCLGRLDPRLDPSLPRLDWSYPESFLALGRVPLRSTL